MWRRFARTALTWVTLPRNVGRIAAIVQVVTTRRLIARVHVLTVIAWDITLGIVVVRNKIL
jgi:hypothetical protein